MPTLILPSQRSEVPPGVPVLGKTGYYHLGEYGTEGS